MSADLDREIKRLSNLKQNQGIPLEDLTPVARMNLEIRDFKSNPLFNIESEEGQKEQKLAESRFKNYLENSEIESASDIDTLKSLIFNEIFEIRIQGELNKLQKDGKYPPDKLIKSLVEVQDQKSSLKVKLGIDKKEEEKDDLSALQLLQKRVHKHIQENKNEFTLYIPWTCEKCGYKDIESYLIYKRVKDFNALKHPWFVGRYLFNYEIIKDVKEKRISLEDATRYLMCSGQGGKYKRDEAKKYCIDYLNYCIENWTEITSLLNKK
jgi:predicted Zn-ribbon and HTH transcriptional regulator